MNIERLFQAIIISILSIWFVGILSFVAFCSSIMFQKHGKELLKLALVLLAIITLVYLKL